MSYYDIMNRMKENPTDGTEYGLTREESIKEHVLIGHTKCDYCGKEIIYVWDKNVENQYWPFLGNQARKLNTYKYSKIIQLMRKFFNCEDKVWDEEHGNNLGNNHARVHSSKANNPKRWSDQSIRLLCNSCFQKTYKRVKVIGTGNDEGIEYALSVLPDRGETVESVMKDNNITGIIIDNSKRGNYAIKDYD